MNKEDFLRELAAELSDLPEKDREDAIKYYSDYIDDAGYDADTVISELGTPQSVASTVRGDSGIIQEEPLVTNPPSNMLAGNDPTLAPANTQAKKRLPAWAIVLLTILSPVLFVLAVVAVAIILLLSIIILAIPLALVVMTLCFVTGGFLLLGAGVSMIASYTPAALMTTAGSFGLLGFGCIFMVLSFAAFTKVLPALFRALFSRKAKGSAANGEV